MLTRRRWPQCPLPFFGNWWKTSHGCFFCSNIQRTSSSVGAPINYFEIQICVPDNPEESNQKKSQQSKQHETPQEWAHCVLSNIHATTLLLDKEQKGIVSDGLKVDQTIALVAFRQKSKSVLPNSFVGNKSTIVVAATTFLDCFPEQPGIALVHWMGVRDIGTLPNTPTFILVSEGNCFFYDEVSYQKVRFRLLESEVRDGCSYCPDTIRSIWQWNCH